jgi:2-dehydro-3-deoxyphosphogluconate aldolase/(4S)-4-hydroxy-2-oxoglutarate aldolase
MDKRTEILNRIGAQGILPLYFHPDAKVSIEVMKALYEAGIRTIEYTNRGEAALNNFRELRKLCDSEFKDLSLGVGTILDTDTASRFIDTGADFLVSPGLAEDIFDTTYSAKILWIAGCMTPTEMMKASQFGMELIKLFPAGNLGAGYIRAVKEVFPGLRIMPTGGISLERQSLQAWFEAGVFAVGLGGKLIEKSTVQKKDYSKITVLAKECLTAISQIRKKL